MRIMLDCAEQTILKREALFGWDFWQLRTPISRHKITKRPYGLDNGCFTSFRERTWTRMLVEARENKPVFVCLPDIVGDARRTLELFEQFETVTEGLPRALVLQDGIGALTIPWSKIEAVFVGGTDNFKISPECTSAVAAAKILNKWIHVGRINSAARLSNWLGVGDSLDGSGISKIDYRLGDLLSSIKSADDQHSLL